MAAATAWSASACASAAEGEGTRRRVSQVGWPRYVQASTAASVKIHGYGWKGLLESVQEAGQARVNLIKAYTDGVHFRAHKGPRCKKAAKARLLVCSSAVVPQGLLSAPSLGFEKAEASFQGRDMGRYILQSKRSLCRLP